MASRGKASQKGSKTFQIITPQIIKRENDQGEVKSALVGFNTCPVFRVEDTDGKELEISDFTPQELPPLYEVAQAWNLNVEWVPPTGNFAGRFSPSRGEIQMATEDENVFFHELAHSSHNRLLGSITQVPLWKKEVIAELTAAVLAQLYGKKLNLGGHYHYIADYSEKEGINAYHACLSVLGDVQACLIMIIGEQDGLKKAA